MNTKCLPLDVYFQIFHTVLNMITNTAVKLLEMVNKRFD